MKFFCTKENINNGLALVGHVATKSTSLPILNNILLKTTPGGLQLTATNLEVAITTIIRGKTEGEGNITVQGKLLIEAAALLPDDKVELLVDNGSLTITCGRSRTVIKGAPAEDFPVIPQINGGNKFIIPTQKLAEAVSRVVFTVNPDEGRPEISGVFLGNVSKKTVLVGTDSYRLAENTLGESKNIIQPEGLIIPLRTAQEVGRISQSSDIEQIEVVLGDNQVLWQIGETQIISRLVSGQYPDYLQIIPKEFSTTAKLNREALQQAVRAASLFVRSGINDVRLKFKVSDKTVLVSSTNSQLGENTTEVGAEIDGEETEVIFNYRYLLDGLSVIPGREIKIKVAGPNSPSLFEPKDGTDYRYLIMPIRQ
ncbi:MAG: polymerase III subunit beta protein [Parcubacteria group bacterium GW2011_GWD2_43_10]|uniref:Beta sliding clamp n=5 Tax=Candidatus Vebleniibacteriota TaxID=1817921 RepID=A0A1G2Q3D5_9BACT|nr:MAG: polymerase III subunit beta protein [Parcubacteria group bacterium GW2011_GWA2_42_80]KKS79081.1 MAG: polymerase III subunit beta protein [Parcubacteria group bacterium GW2011_GWD1_42_9]KKS80880.1 MAG: polymerase III subunit beta protein [Parcubacteria group bacterium GW2011_GWD2_43_10]KKS92963.1 MAG: polymerase III subunit beta protein [Parcubacteria group bacterium GW2011_GWE2_43_12]KKT12578.1 MAG: polymerase III subunit beta protein [Parcubacteria group bacterium GW2011_GWA1_43_27]KK